MAELQISSSESVVTTLQALDDIIGSYYIKKGKHDYYTDPSSKTGGKFKLFVDENCFEDDSLESELFGDGPSDCSYLEFDDDNSFPFQTQPKDESEHQQMLYDFLKYCCLHGRYPVSLKDPDKIDFSMLDSMYDADKTQHIRDKYTTQCPTICGPLAQQSDDNMFMGLTVGFENNVPFLQNVSDIYQRDKMQLHLQNKGLKYPPLTHWFNNNPFMQQVNKRYTNGNVIEVMKHGVSSYIRRIQPEFQATSPVFGKIADDILEIARYFQEASQFISFLLRQNDGTGASVPFQFDFAIAVKEAVHVQTFVKPETSDDDDEEEEDKNEDDEHPFYDCIGDIKKKLEDNELIHKWNVIDRQEHSDQEVRNVTRIFTETYNHLKQEMHQKQGKKFPRKKRFIAVIDRRQSVTTYTGKVPNIKMHTVLRIQHAQKKDDVVFFGPPDNASDIPADHVPEIYFNHLLQCLIPNLDYVDEKVEYMDGKGAADERANAISDSVKECVKKKKIVSHITGLSSCNGALLTFSFQVEQENEIKCYLWWQGKCIRFLPSDVIDILPQIFDEKAHANNKLFATSAMAKGIVKSIHYKDVQFNHWFTKISVLDDSAANLTKYL
eukprot:181634_1